VLSFRLTTEYVTQLSPVTSSPYEGTKVDSLSSQANCFRPSSDPVPLQNFDTTKCIITKRRSEI